MTKLEKLEWCLEHLPETFNGNPLKEWALKTYRELGVYDPMYKDWNGKFYNPDSNPFTFLQAAFEWDINRARGYLWGEVYDAIKSSEIVPVTTVEKKIPSDYELWKAGKLIRAQTLEGKDVFKLTDFETQNYPLVGVVDGCMSAWTRNGIYSIMSPGYKHNLHLVITEEQPCEEPEWIETIEDSPSETFETEMRRRVTAIEEQLKMK